MPCPGSALPSRGELGHARSVAVPPLAVLYDIATTVVSLLLGTNTSMVPPLGMTTHCPAAFVPSFAVSSAVTDAPPKRT